MLTEKRRHRETDQRFAFRGLRAMQDGAGLNGSPGADFCKAPPAASCEPAARALFIAEPVKPAAWTIELERISQSVPSFAIWQIATLEQCFHRYCNILQVAGRDVRFRRNCMTLMANAERISEKLNAARETRQWPPFDRAAFELRQDCEQLAILVAAAS